ncbi:recombinase family protein [Streptomyces sp. TLI_146]|uniref:recombinase family protein n=1 Tax=Streptomyces sp. TLI_146 TaxID=1938858 RepID=UPI000C70489E|nr:recombinase family protein [Streptomyces sp. TLI_146]PKV88186.1 DNA invertase Pin-like site-specific DNA recombinase [Streptomyces sp. TLI_146]
MPHDYIKARAAALAKAAQPPRIELWVDYARKSTVGLERQALSIPSQIEQMNAAFPDLPRFGKPVTESKSAFKPGRKKFNWIIERVEAGEISGIISWHPNRLSRNMEDASTIVRLVGAGKLDLKFVTFTFEKTPEGLMLLRTMLSQGQYESERLARDVRRGTDKKAEQGWYPGPVPLGYNTDGDRKKKGSRTIVEDQARLPIIERGMAYALTGNYTTAELRRLMAEEWGLTIRETEKRPSRPIGYGGVWAMLRNVFYTGHFIWNGELRQGSHKAVISLDQYERLQEIFRGHTSGDTRRLVTRAYVKFSGILNCGRCGRVVTCTEKRKYYATTNREAIYVYYHCSRNSRRRCAERPISEPKLVSAILEALSSYRLISEFRDMAYDVLIKDFRSKRQGQAAELEGQKAELLSLEKKDRGLVEMRASGEIDRDDYKLYHGGYKKRMAQLKRLVGRPAELDWSKLVGSIKAIHFAASLREPFLQADGVAQRRLLIELADKVVIERGKVLIEAKKWLRPLGDSFLLREANYELDRTSDFGSTKQKAETFASAFSLWYARVNTMADLIEEEVKSGRTVHAEVRLPAELQARLDALRQPER